MRKGYLDKKVFSWNFVLFYHPGRRPDYARTNVRDNKCKAAIDFFDTNRLILEFSQPSRRSEFHRHVLQFNPNEFKVIGRCFGEICLCVVWG